LVTFYVKTAFYKGVTEGKIQGGIEVTGRQGRRRRKLLDDLKERRGYSHLKEELWIAVCGQLASEEALDLS
jgi:membrane protein implicated in regulation of membrane protease activity